MIYIVKEVIKNLSDKSIPSVKIRRVPDVQSTKILSEKYIREAKRTFGCNFDYDKTTSGRRLTTYTVRSNTIYEHVITIKRK